MSLIQRFRVADGKELVDPSDYGFVALDAKLLEDDEQVIAYLKYRESGGAEISAWEKIIRRLSRSGRLDQIRTKHQKDIRS
jgi:hypothetical protein